MKTGKIGGISFIPEETRKRYDAELVKIAHNSLALTKENSSEMMDYDYNCLVGALRYRITKLSESIEQLRLNDIESMAQDAR